MKTKKTCLLRNYVLSRKKKEDHSRMPVSPFKPSRPSNSVCPGRWMKPSVKKKTDSTRGSAARTTFGFIVKSQRSFPGIPPVPCSNLYRL
ncbi:hypothetical protein RB195_006145 [Necator americanus]|uniref:Uncharacterized protein n=1 Tax=Necator americanus TaxID=51031 RepID=A0ABR1BR75_NECAM